MRGPSALFQRDAEHRSLLHVAIGVKYESSHLITSILNAYFELSIAKFIHDISELEYEKQLCVEASQNAVVRNDSNKARKHGNLNPSNPISKWFAKECKRALIRAIIRNEVRTI